MTGNPAPATPPPGAPRPARPRALLCPGCAAPVTLHTGGSTVTAVCPACATVLDVGQGPDDPLRIVAAAAARTRAPAIPIGTRGTLDGTEWQVTGYQIRSVQDGAWPWDEYLLFNPYAGFRFLLHDGGAWSLFELLRRDFAAGPPPGFHPGETATARTDYVLGEFYWRVRVGDQVQVREYQNPPLTLSEERNGTEVTWSQGHALDAAAVRAAFNLPGLPGRNAPAPAVRGRWWVALAASILLALLSLAPFGQGRDQLLLRKEFEARDPAELTVAELDLPGRGGTLALDAGSPFTGAAASARLRLLPVAGPGAGVTAVMTFGGPFGDATPQRVVFGSVPGGRYRLVAEVDTPDFHAPPRRDATVDFYNGLLSGAGVPALPQPTQDPVTVPVTVALRRHPPGLAAPVLALVCILAWPLAAAVLRALRRLPGG